MDTRIDMCGGHIRYLSKSDAEHSAAKMAKRFLFMAGYVPVKCSKCEGWHLDKPRTAGTARPERKT